MKKSRYSVLERRFRRKSKATENSYEANLSVWSDEMEREGVLKDLSHQIENLSRLQPQYRLHRTGDFDKLRLNIRSGIQAHGVNVRQEFEPHIYNLYRRYFD